MKILRVNVKAHPKSKLVQVEERDGVYHVWIHESPSNGKANESVKKVLAKYFKVAKSDVVLVRGHHSRAKVFDIRKRG